MAIGAKENDGNGNDSGHVRVYQNDNGTWTKIGDDIDGEAASDYSGYSVSLSSDGTIVAIGGVYNTGANGAYSGHVRVYQNVNGTWTKIGDDIDGEAVQDFSGYSVSLSSDGSVVAIGAFYNDGNGSNSGHVRIYQNDNGTWTKIGDDIDGEASGDQSGISVSLSADGSTVAIGAPQNDENGNASGHVRVFQNTSGNWTQVAVDINGEAAGDQSGISVSLSADGSTVAVGAHKNDDSGDNAGHVRVYESTGTTGLSFTTLVDGIVEGVEYTSSSGISGLTTKEGYFNYLLGDDVSFNIGNVSLGSVSSEDLASGNIFLQDIADVERTNLNDEYVENMAVFLQSLDENNDASDGITITEQTRDLLSNVDLDLRTATEEDVKNVISEVGGSYINESQAMIHVQEMLIKYTDLKVDDFEIHQPDNDFLTEDLVTNLNDHDPITGLSYSEDTLREVEPDNSITSEELDIITNYSPELQIEDDGIQDNQITRKIFTKTQDLEFSLKGDIDDFDLMNGQNNSSINTFDEELLVLSESEPDPINL